jgi:hypothetical protein
VAGQRELAHESEADKHDLNVLQAIRLMNEIMVANFAAFHDLVSDKQYDLCHLAMLESVPGRDGTTGLEPLPMSGTRPPARTSLRTAAPRGLWARRPETAGGNVHPVHAGSSRIAVSPPSRCQAARSPAPTTPFTTVPGTQKTPLLIGKGP